MDSNKTKICPKLRPQHIAIRGRERQIAYLVLQLFSNRTAQAIRYLVPGETVLANFVQLINDSFDVLNSRKPHSNVPQACGFGLHYQLQERSYAISILLVRV